MHSLSSYPINALTWTWGGLVMYIFALKSLGNYRRTKNPVARIYYCLGMAFCVALLLFGIPGLLTKNTSLLLHTYFLADLFVQISMQIQVWLLWFIALQGRIKLKYLLAFSLPYSALLLVAEVMTSQTTISQSPHLILYSDKPLVSLLKSIIYLVIAVPLGYFLLTLAPSQTNLRAKLKSSTGGLIFIAVSVAATINNIFDKGSDTVSSSISVAIFFAIFLLAQLLRAQP